MTTYKQQKAIEALEVGRTLYNEAVEAGTDFRAQCPANVTYALVLGTPEIMGLIEAGKLGLAFRGRWWGAVAIPMMKEKYGFPLVKMLKEMDNVEVAIQAIKEMGK